MMNEGKKPQEEWFENRQVAFKNAFRILTEIGYVPEVIDIIEVAEFLVKDVS